MAVEQKRNCGYRKVGGMYFVGEHFEIKCDNMPFILRCCPVCNVGMKPSLGFRWILPRQLFNVKCSQLTGYTCLRNNLLCPFMEDGRHGLMWVGRKFYTPDKFVGEAKQMGVSKRINAIPHGFELGKTIVFLAHRDAGIENVAPDLVMPDDKVLGDTVSPNGLPLKVVSRPGVFYVFIPKRIEKIITQSQSQDKEYMDKLNKRNITPVIVPDDDKDHTGTVYDKKSEGITNE